MPKGMLTKNLYQRFEIQYAEDPSRTQELTSGQIFELFNQVTEQWDKVRLEFDGAKSCYYAVTDDGPIYNLEDQFARV